MQIDMSRFVLQFTFFLIQQDTEHLKNLFEPSRVEKHRKSVKRKRVRPCWLVIKTAEAMALVMASCHGDYAHLNTIVVPVIKLYSEC